MTLFSGTDSSVATRELSTAVNAAIQLQKPLLIKSEPVWAKRCWPLRLPGRWVNRRIPARKINHHGAAGVVRIRRRNLDVLNELPPFLGSLLKNEQDTDLMTALRKKGGRLY